MSINVGLSLDNDTLTDKINSPCNTKFMLTNIEANLLQTIINKNAPFYADIRDWLPSIVRKSSNKYPVLDWCFISDSNFLINPKKDTIQEKSHQLRIQYCRNSYDLVLTILFCDIWSNGNALYRFIKLTDIEMISKKPILKMVDCPIVDIFNSNPSRKWLSLSIFDLIFVPDITSDLKNMILDKMYAMPFSKLFFNATDDIDFQFEYLRRHLNKFGCNSLFILHQCMYVWLKRSIKDEFPIAKLTSFVIELINKNMLTIKRLKRYNKPINYAFIENVILLIQVDQLVIEPSIIPIKTIKMTQKPMRI